MNYSKRKLKKKNTTFLTKMLKISDRNDMLLKDFLILKSRMSDEHKRRALKVKKHGEVIDWKSADAVFLGKLGLFPSFPIGYPKYLVFSMLTLQELQNQTTQEQFRDIQEFWRNEAIKNKALSSNVAEFFS